MIWSPLLGHQEGPNIPAIPQRFHKPRFFLSAKSQAVNLPDGLSVGARFRSDGQVPHGSLRALPLCPFNHFSSPSNTFSIDRE